MQPLNAETNVSVQEEHQKLTRTFETEVKNFRIHNAINMKKAHLFELEVTDDRMTRQNREYQICQYSEYHCVVFIYYSGASSDSLLQKFLHTRMFSWLNFVSPNRFLLADQNCFNAHVKTVQKKW